MFMTENHVERFGKQYWRIYSVNIYGTYTICNLFRCYKECKNECLGEYLQSTIGGERAVNNQNDSYYVIKYSISKQVDFELGRGQ